MADCKDTQADQVHGKVDTKTHTGEQPEVCEQCKVHKNLLPAIGWCETCDEMLCNGCYEYHCRPKSMRNHRLMSIAEMTNMKQTKRLSIRCDAHAGEALKYFCEDHAELGCSQCFVTRHRPCGEVVCIADVNTNDSKEFKELETLFSQFEKRLKTNDETIERNVGLAARLHDKAIADIKAAGDKLKVHIDDLVKQQILKAQQRNEDNMSNMSCVVETKKGIAIKVKDGKEMIAEANNDNTRLFVTMKSLQLETGVMNSQLDECEQKNTLRKYEFELSSDLADVLEKVKHLGTLKDTQVLNMEKATDEVVDVVDVRRFTQLRYDLSVRGYITDVIRVSTDHDIRLLHVLVYARMNDDTHVSLTISEKGNCLMRCNGSHKIEAGQQVVAVHVGKEGGADGITLQTGHQYVIDVIREEIGWDYYYYGGSKLSKVTEKGVTVTFSNTAKTNNARGNIAGLRFTII